jgi:hypothetical protein
MAVFKIADLKARHRSGFENLQSEIFNLPSGPPAQTGNAIHIYSLGVAIDELCSYFRAVPVK